MSKESTIRYVAPLAKVLEMAPDDAMLLETSGNGRIDDLEEGEYVW